MNNLFNLLSELRATESSQRATTIQSLNEKEAGGAALLIGRADNHKVWLHKQPGKEGSLKAISKVVATD